MSERYISCALMGGLGNQLFQIFTTIAYGLQNRRRILFPYSEYLTTGTKRATYWGSFLSAIRSFTDEKTPTNVSRFPVYREPCFEYQPIPRNFTNENIPMLLYGYYQSYKYFDSEKKAICSLIRLSEQKASIREEYDYFACNDDVGTITISMHFRLGDYKNIQEFHPLLDKGYYIDALSHFMRQFPEKSIRVLYFCEKDDNNVVSNIIGELPQDSRLQYVKVDDAIPDWKQMLLMSCCHSNIIANSTFSWWGAYLNENSEKSVYYPSVWFGSRLADHNTRALFPEEWIKLNIGQCI